MGPQPITRAVLPATSPARETACQATLAGSTSAAVLSSRPAGQGTEHPGRKGGVPAEGPVGVRETCGAAQVGAARGKVRTVCGVPGGARPRRGRMHGDGRACRRPGAVAGRQEHGSHDFVAQDHGRLEDRFARRAVDPVVQVRAADAAEGDFDNSFIGRRYGHRERPQSGDRPPHGPPPRPPLPAVPLTPRIRPPPSFRRR